MLHWIRRWILADERHLSPFAKICLLAVEIYTFFNSQVRPQRASLMAQMVKNLPAMQEIQVQSLGWEDPLKEEVTIHSRILAWRIPWTEEPGGLQSMGSQRVGHDWATNTFTKSQSTHCLNSGLWEWRKNLPNQKKEFCLDNLTKFFWGGKY